MSLGLTALTFLTCIMSFNTLASSFNDWTVSVELCKETMDVASTKTRDLGLVDRENFNKILTCLGPKGK